ncbi:zinc-binding protein [Sinimarinibacterium sp. CAU 1509]|uniref:putative zinc-binding protein n=1 Tax=Sinimarinibacterium sp. CAU 1509 TaxID=2562283 RepID=UPI0010AD574A|nr:putative zinc-binding protein [Sinimarinibacterium sp. CAU 1509]TJY56211.1 zinc-binding protein [Sinimarinibacterium sp. CAU 1509]
MLDTHSNATASRTGESAAKPLVFACAGCSHVARLSYDLARELDRRGIAEMSCLAGLGALKPAFVKEVARRTTWVIDGCPIECGAGVFARNGHAIGRHIKLHELGFRKYGEIAQDFDMGGLIRRL